uniref:Beta-microseminoprotein n=1 Tax=Periophthalmus magnuspinnatus TaxID=409849 RepID=A0A3B4BJH7_9GOBI
MNIKVIVMSLWAVFTFQSGCVDKNGEEHKFDSEWVEDCMDCSCTSDGLSCCIPEDCELVLDKEDCSAKAVFKWDKTKECSPI